MVWTGGGSALARGLELLEVALQDYFGTLNEIEQGLNVDVPVKPEALVYWEMMQFSNLPVVSGGLIDQPHIFQREMIIVANQVTLNERLRRLSLSQKE